MLTGYFDETGLNSAEKVCIVGGFIGNDAQWGAFANDWVTALGQHRKNLHMRKLRWNRRYAKIVSDLLRLGAIPSKYNLSMVLGGMRHSHYEQIMKGRIREKYTNPYMACAQTCISTTLKFVAGKDDEVLFIFDRQEGRRAEAIEMLQEVVFKWAKFDPRLKDIRFIDHTTTVCIDPADYLVFAMRENLIEPKGKKAVASRPILRPYKKWRKGIFSRQQVANMAKRAIAAGMIPGGGSIQMTPDFAATLAEAGWSHHDIQKLAIHLRAIHLQTSSP